MALSECMNPWEMEHTNLLNYRQKKFLVLGTRQSYGGALVKSARHVNPNLIFSLLEPCSSFSFNKVLFQNFILISISLKPGIHWHLINPGIH